MYMLMLAGTLAALISGDPSTVAQPPDFSGHWQLNESQSRAAAGQNLSLEIQQSGQKVTFTRVNKQENNKQLTSHFVCEIGGSQCDFDENGHKAKVSLWYDGPTLVILKTGGDKQDPTVEWRLKMDSDGKTIKVEREQMEPIDRTEKLVYNKTEALAAR